MSQYRLADIYARYWDSFLKHPGVYIPPRVFKAVNQTMACRTSRLGASVYTCPECEQREFVYHSCKNRFCPRCGYTETRDWGQRLLGVLVEVRHHHVTFTLPEALLPLAHRFPRAVYNALFSAASWVLKDWFRFKHSLRPGIIAVLHTAGFALKRHIHLHLLVSGGGVRNGEWHELEGNYLTRLDWFRDRFRWRFEHDLLLALRRGELGDMKEAELKSLFKRLNGERWVVAVQKGLRRPERIVRYIGRYIKRAPLAEHNIKAIEEGKIAFLCKSYREKSGNKPRNKLVTLSAQEFLKRLVVHVPLEGFHLVRYYGAYHPQSTNARPAERQTWRDLQIEKTGSDPLCCPCCGAQLIFCGVVFPRELSSQYPRVAYADTG